MHFKSIIKCFKEVRIDKWPDLPYSFPPQVWWVIQQGRRSIFRMGGGGGGGGKSKENVKFFAP